MREKTTSRIEAWFAEHGGDGDFGFDPSTPYQVISPASRVGRVVFATKSFPVVHAINECGARAGLGVIARYGLPSENDIRWIADFAAKHELLFLGDMDPVDLLIFAWLRAHLRPERITHLGVNDAYLAALKVDLPESFILACSPSEQASLPLLEEILPDLGQTLGPMCYSTLQQGRKIELEAIVSTLGTPNSILLPAVKRPVR